TPLPPWPSTLSLHDALPIWSLCRRPSSSSSILARSTPTTSPTSGVIPAIGPPSCPVKIWASLSACSSVACSSINTPTRQFPSVSSEEHTSELQSRENLVCRL